MIQFDPSPQALFNPFGIGIKQKQALLIFDDEAWEDYVPTLPTESSSANKNFLVYKDTLLVAPANTAGGAAMSVQDFEILIASGVKKFVAFGTCGSLKLDLAQNIIIIPAAAIREEGVSYHYLPPGDEVTAPSLPIELFKKYGLETATGKVWTTDAVFRETADKVKMMQQKGCIAVDMELSAMLAVAQFRKVKFAQFLIIQDNVVGKFTHKLDRDPAKLFAAAMDLLTIL
ncbi:nucleoside phosphorylase [Candidatus Saccharibacteria bacterium]|nr:nucleoside phosphorylase [Candidatus Saccharibacteria bacterium]